MGEVQFSGTESQIVRRMPPKNKKKNKNVVRVQLAPSKKKKRSKSVKVPRGLSLGTAAKQYLTALADPFNERACGARVPDQYSCHTTTYELRATHTVTAGGSGSIGVWVLPNVVTSMVVPNGVFSGSSTITWLDNTTTGTVFRWGFDSTVLGNKLQNYRIVGMGVRVANMSSMTNSQGKFILGSYPINASYVTRDFNVAGLPPTTNLGGTIANTFSKWGIPYTSSVDYATLVNYPGTRVLSALEVAESEFDVIPKPCQPSAFEFREPNDSLQGFSYNSTSGGSGDPSYLKLDGFEACFVAATGLVPSTSSVDIEIVYHIEGAPVILAGSPAAAFINQQGTQSPTDMQGFMKAIDTAFQLPAVRKVVHVAADMMHPLLGEVARAIL